MKVPSAKPFFPEEDIEKISSEIEENLRKGELTLGSKITKFEELFAKYVGVKHGIAVNSGTAALEIVLRYFELDKGEVIVPTNSFVSSANTVYFAGGKPVLADINEDTLCLDPESLKECITSKTKGVILVHLAGLITPHLKDIQEICIDKKLFLIEDAAQAHGASIDGKKAGSLVDAACFSFFPTKPMTTGEGGMVTTDNEKLNNLARSLRHHGIESRDNYPRLGYNWRMSDINAILGIYQLQRLDQFVKKRNEIAKAYHKGLSHFKDIKFIHCTPNIVHAYYKYPIILPFDTSNLQKILEKKYEISTGFLYYPPIHLQPLYQEKFGYKTGMLPKSEDVLKRVLCLPMFTEITAEQIRYIIGNISTELERLGLN